MEGVDTLLYDLNNDPLELENFAYREIQRELESILFENLDLDELYQTIAEDQRRRLYAHKTTGGEPTYVNIVRLDDGERYMRNAGATDTKAKARFPYVTRAQPDKVK